MGAVTVTVTDSGGHTASATAPYSVGQPQTSAVFSAVPGPATQGASGGTAGTRARVAAAFGVPVLPVDRVYSSTGYGKATASPSPRVAVSYAQVPTLARGDAATIKALTAELKLLAAKTHQQWDVSCDHEVDAEIRSGTYTGDDVEKAAASFAQIVRSLGAPNIRVAGCWTGYSLTLPTSNASNPSNYVDPASYDLLTFDPYWPAQPTALKAFDPSWNFAQSIAPQKPVAVWETGFQTGSSPQTLTDAQLGTKVQAVIDYWRPKAEYVLWYESFHAVSNLLEGRHPAQELWSAAVQGS